MDDLYVYGIKVEINRKKIKNMYLRVKNDGSVTVSVPISMDNSRIKGFVMSRADWIKNAVNESQKNNTVGYNDGAKIGLFGKEYTLRLDTERMGVYRFEDGCLFLGVGRNSTAESREKAVAEIYRQAMEQILPEIAERCQRDSGLYANEWRIKNMKTRWGSCNTKDKRIWISLWLASKPVMCLEATVYHELTHLKVRGHGRDFYDLLLKICPNYREADKFLK